MIPLPLMFLHPWILSAVAALPVIWLILRVLPPPPKTTFLPTARFLLGHNQNRVTPNSAPWWLILLRLLIMACLILAFAEPVLNPQKTENKKSPLNLVVDNGWASAQIWSLQTRKAEELLQAARRSGIPVRLQFTASDNPPGFIRADQALSYLRSAQPQSWPGNPLSLKTDGNVETAWISSGLAENGFTKTAEAFAKNGLTVYVPDIKDRPGIVHGPAPENLKSLLKLEIPPGSVDRNLTIQAFDKRGKLVGRLHRSVSGQSGGEKVIDADLSATKISRWKIVNFSGAGGVYLNDTVRAGGLIGVFSGTQSSDDNFSNASFYLSRAMENFAQIELGSIDELIKKNCAVIVLPDISVFQQTDLSSLQAYFDKGGVVLRFGGKNMAEADNVLTPVKLKTGLRSLSGDMTWTIPLKLAAFPKTSPFADTAIPDITVERQLLAEPSAELENNTWAKLSDGTPFITARHEGRGLLVLVHTTATPEWSDFVLSGFYVTFLKEMLELAALPDKSKAQETIFQPSLLLNGWGDLVAPDADAKPITKAQLEKIIPDRHHPPGYYSTDAKKISLNLGDRIERLELIDRLPVGAKAASLNDLSKERKLSAWFLILAAILLLIDWLILISLPRLLTLKILAVALLFFALPAHADTDMDRASEIHLACVHSSNDKSCLAALNHIASAVTSRTAAEMGSSVIVDPEKDDLSFYPLIYWPIDTDDTYGAAGRSAIASYLSKGGMILIDTRDGTYSAGQIAPSSSAAYMREQLQGIEIAALKPITRSHVLFKSFYLLNLYPEYDLTGKIWVAEDSMPPDENLSPVMITGEDWMNKWAYPSTPRDDEMAERFGVNLVMYALTGSYKSDQVHMKAILQRMGQ